MKYYSLLIFIYLSFHCLGQQEWENIGPFYGKSDNSPYLHAMGLISAVHLDPENPDIIVAGTSASGIWKTYNKGKDWKCVTENKSFLPGMGISFISENPDNSSILMASTSNTVYGEDNYSGPVLISRDFGDTWTVFSAFNENSQSKIPLHKVVQKSNNRIYIMSYDKLYYSNNFGKTWITLFNLDEKESYVDHIFQNLSDIEVFENGNILLTGGQKWGSSASLWFFHEATQQWTLLNQSTPFSTHLKNAKINCTKITEPKNETSYIGVSAFDSLIVFRYTNEKMLFEKVGSFRLNYGTGSAPGYKFEMETSSTNPNKIFFGFIHFFEWEVGGNLNQLSKNGNLDATTHVDVRGMKSYYTVNNEEIILIGNDGGVSAYFPQKKDFESFNGMRFPVTQIWRMGISQYSKDQKIIIGTQDNGTFEYKNKEWKWISDGDGGASWYSKDGGKKIASTNGSSRFYDGTSPRSQYFFSPNSSISSWFIDYPLEVSDDEKRIYWGSGERNDEKKASLFIRKNNGGIRQLKVDIRQIGCIGISATDSNLIYLSDKHIKSFLDSEISLIKSIDGGDNFKDITSANVYSSNFKDTISLYELLDWKTITDIEIDPFDKEHLYLSLAGYRTLEMVTHNHHKYRILESKDGGKSWVDITEGIPSIPCHRITYLRGSNDVLFAGTDDGIFIKTQLNSWQRFGSNFPLNTVVTDIIPNYITHELFVSTYGRGVWKIQLPQFEKTTLKIKDNIENSSDIIYQNIKVSRKKTLILKDTVRLSKNTVFILEPKSKIEIDGATIISNLEEKELFNFGKRESKCFLFRKKEGEVIFRNGGKIVVE